MCLGIVVLPGNGTTPDMELTEVLDVVIEAGRARIRTLFDEIHDVPDVAIRRIEMQRGLTITLTREIPE
jgi:hypothetical protein